jgi:transcriptional regulator GlxA family with amidase domain
MSQHSHQILLLAFPLVQSLDVTGPLEVFAAANRAMEEDGKVAPYQITLAGPHKGPVDSTCGIPLLASAGFLEQDLSADTVILAGGSGARECINDRSLIEKVRVICEQSRRVVSICTGAFPLAATGLLDGHHATTHWSRCAEFETQFPLIDLDPNAIFVSDGKFHTSAGVTAGIDLSLALVEQDLGCQIALEVARELVVFLKRPGGQSQFSARLTVQADMKDSDRFSELVRWVANNLHKDLSVEILSARLAMSPRNFTRRFLEVIGQTPAKYVNAMRIDAARRLLTDGEVPIGTVAKQCGFNTIETMRVSFQRYLKVSPQDFRDRFQSIDVPGRIPGPGRKNIFGAARN